MFRECPGKTKTVQISGYFLVVQIMVVQVLWYVLQNRSWLPNVQAAKDLCNLAVPLHSEAPYRHAIHINFRIDTPRGGSQNAVNLWFSNKDSVNAGNGQKVVGLKRKEPGIGFAGVAKIVAAVALCAGYR